MMCIQLHMQKNENSPTKRNTILIMNGICIILYTDATKPQRQAQEEIQTEKRKQVTDKRVSINIPRHADPSEKPLKKTSPQQELQDVVAAQLHVSTHKKNSLRRKNTATHTRNYGATLQASIRQSTYTSAALDNQTSQPQRVNQLPVATGQRKVTAEMPRHTCTCEGSSADSTFQKNSASAATQDRLATSQKSGQK